MKRYVWIMMLALAALLLCACAKNNPAEGSAPADESDATYTISTKYCNLQYPKAWEDAVEIETDEAAPYTVRFLVDGADLFDVTFNGSDGDLLGSLITDDGPYTVRVLTHDSSTFADPERARQMQEDIDCILQHLISDYEFEAGKALGEEVTAVFPIRLNDDLTLYYPKRWEQKVAAETSDSSLKLTSGGNVLFEVLLGDSDRGDLVGSYRGEKLYIVSESIEQGSLPDSEYDALREMQEDFNVMLEYLLKDEAFTVANHAG